MEHEGLEAGSFSHNVCVVGTGRVGLPLALSMIEVGLSVVGLDTDEALREKVNAGVMPFKEPFYDELIERKTLQVTGDSSIIADCRDIVITVGTPLHTHIETDLTQIKAVLGSISPWLRKGHLICLRSTVAPGTTVFVKKWLERNTDFTIGEDLFLTFCPERIAEGKAYEELRSLAQIIGSADAESGQRAASIFSRLAPELFHTDYVSAELVKLFNNISRYVHFAMANQFALIADTFDANIYEIRRMANHNYPRSHLAMPGFTAGTCLRKDFGMINEWSPYPDMMLAAWKMNEFIPAFLVTHLKKRFDIHDRNVAVLGYTFKKDTDDTRDSLAPKLMRYIERELPREVRLSDLHLPSPTFTDEGRLFNNYSAQDAFDGVDCVFVATNHSAYKADLELLAETNPQAWVVDIWNVANVDRIFYQAALIRSEHGSCI
jgi:UDP-N-acetyl-D-mannosaminuronic acid dehydrogenase